MTKRARLNDIVRFCQIRFNRGEGATWKHSNFLDLSRDIYQDTRINISPITLKRIFGKISVDEDYVPQQATLDALIKYGRYTETEDSQAEIAIKQPTNLLVNKWKTPVWVLIISCAIAACLLLSRWPTKPETLSGEIKIASTEGILPSTVLFNLQTPVTEDSLFVDFGDKSTWAYIPKGQRTVAHIYYIPGLFSVTLQTRKQRVSAATAYVRSKGWMSFAFHNQQEIPNRFYELSTSRTVNDSILVIKNTQLQKLGLDTTGVFLTRLCNYSKVRNPSEDFIFETTFKNDLAQKYNYCRSTQFQISGKNSLLKFRLVSSGCSQRVINIMSEQIFNGAKNNLSRFVLDLKNWNKVKLINHKKQVSIYLNGQLLFSGKYERPLGELRGVFLEFEGAGMVKSCQLRAYDGNLIYNF